MNIPRKTFIAAALSACAAIAATSASAQSTDGYHSIQVFPVVVDSASFTQRFVFRNPDPDNAITVNASFYPGTGTAQTTPTTCPAFSIPADGQREFTSLRSLCPGMVAGNTFGYLYTNDADPTNKPFAAFSRVSNSAGAGFSVEAFPAHTFTSADAVVTGLRRLAASGATPAFQTNCFIGNLHDVTAPATPTTTEVFYTLYDSNNAQVGSTTSVMLTPGKLTRLLDVFTTAGAPAGNYDNVRVKFEEVGPDEPGLMTYCTVQDNTSFGADFRIGKQEQGFSTPYSSIGAQDDSVSRDSVAFQDLFLSGDVSPRQFDIPAGAFSNTHVIYFRHPDRIQCELVNPATDVRLTPDDSLEMRLLDGQGNLVAGGNNVIGFSEIYLGDKTDRNFGANGRYSIEVESSGAGLNVNQLRNYGIHCQSGSGHSVADIVRYHEPVTRF